MPEGKHGEKGFFHNLKESSTAKTVKAAALALGLATGSSAMGEDRHVMPPAPETMAEFDKGPEVMDKTLRSIDDVFNDSVCIDKCLVEKSDFEKQIYTWMLKNRFSGKKSPEFVQLNVPENRKRIFDLAKKIGQEKGVDPYLILGLAATESQFDSKAVSAAGAAGIMQIMPDTFRQAGFSLPSEINEGYYWKTYLKKKGQSGPAKKKVLQKQLIDPSKDARFDEEICMRAGVKIFLQEKEKFGDDELALLAYSTGRGNLLGLLKRFGAKNLLDLYTKIKQNPKNKTEFLYYPIVVKLLMKDLREKYPENS